MELIIQTKALMKTYGSGPTAVTALHPTNLCVHRGEFLAIVGPSGSGKSTLLHLLGGLETPSGGQILVDGAELTAL